MDKAIELISVTKSFNLVKALNNLNFSVEKGSLHGFLGPNGAGKSTTMNLIAGQLLPNSGQILVNGLDLLNENLAKPLIGYLPENPPLYPNMKVVTYLSFISKIWKIPKNQLKNRVQDVIKTCKLESVQNRIIGNLSKGFKQRVGLAQAIIHNPEIVILDEPMVGLDPHARTEIRSLIKNLAKKHTVLLSTHQLHEITLICTHISIINKGSIVASGKVDDIKSKFLTHQQISATVENWNSDLLKKLETQLNIDEIKQKKVNGAHELTFITSTTDDIRISLSNFLLENQCGILNFNRDEAEIEDIFKHLTTDKNHSGGLHDAFL